MFCPECRDEYRPGFTRCATCDLDLVESLETSAPAHKPAPAIVSEIAVDEPMANLCGFLSIDEARDAREKVRQASLPVEILIRDIVGDDGAVQEEYWLRARPKDFRVVAGLVGYAPPTTEHAEDEFTCSACGATVRASDDACPGCGLGFEG